MDRASKAFRRSGVRLKALGGGHGDISMVISELKDVRQAAKLFMQAQATASQDMMKWSMNDENRAIQDAVNQLAELNSLWTEVQKEFTDNETSDDGALANYVDVVVISPGKNPEGEQLKDFKYQFEMILEGERHVDQGRNHLSACEQRELKIKKELKKAAKYKATQEEMKQLEIKLAQAERAKDMAQVEVVDKIRENEALKMVRFKEGLLKLSDAYCELAHKCAIIFGAQRDIACQLPDVTNQDLHEMKYTGSGVTKQTVIKAKERVRQYRRLSHHLIAIPPPPIGEPPPPYSPDENFPIDHCEAGARVIPLSCNDNHFAFERRQSQQQRPTSTGTATTTPLRQRVLADHPLPQRQSPASGDDIRWNADFEDDLSGAMGGTIIE